MTVVVVDTETTGLGHVARPARVDAIVSVGLSWRNREGKLQAWESRCHPGAEFLGKDADEALAVNGLSRAALDCYPPAVRVAEQVRYLLEYVGATELRSYNVAFDRPFLEASPWRVSLPWGPCVMLAATPRCAECDGGGRLHTPSGEEPCRACRGSGRGRWLKLKVACEAHGVNPAGPLHSSGHDARLAYKLMEALRSKGLTT